jgi:hypothetical protein
MASRLDWNNKAEDRTMSQIQEYALLIAVAIPVLAVVGLNAFLWLCGERGTLLLPSLATFPSMLEGGDSAVRVDGLTTSSTGGDAPRVAAANDEHAREAA